MKLNASDRAMSRGFADHAPLFYTIAASALVLVTILQYLIIMASAIAAKELPDNAEYQIADWLINYQGGFVRRGFIGQLLYFISDSPSVTMYITLSLQAGILIVATTLTMRLFLKTQRELTWCIFLFSPLFFIEFQFLNEYGSFFKEIIVYLALPLYLLGLHNNQRWQRILAMMIYTVGAFSHELISLCIIFFVWPIWQAIREQNRRDLWPELIPLVLIAGISAITAFLFNGNPEISKGICQSLIIKGFDPMICECGSIGWISSDINGTLAWSNILKDGGYVIWPYVGEAVVGSIPFFAIKDLKRHLIWLILGLIAFAPLFILAYDYGRWMSLFFTLSAINFFYISIHKDFALRKISLIPILLYCCCWSVTHFLAHTFNFGLLNPIALYLFQNM